MILKDNGGYSFESLASRLSIYQRERENLEEFMDDKLKKLVNINKSMNSNGMELNNRYNENYFGNIYNKDYYKNSNENFQ